VTSGGNNFNDFPENQLTKTTDKNEKNSSLVRNRQTQKHVILGHFPKPISWLGMEKTKPNTTKARVHQSKEMYYNTK